MSTRGRLTWRRGDGDLTLDPSILLSYDKTSLWDYYYHKTTIEIPHMINKKDMILIMLGRSSNIHHVEYPAVVQQGEIPVDLNITPVISIGQRRAYKSIMMDTYSGNRSIYTSELNDLVQEWLNSLPLRWEEWHSTHPLKTLVLYPSLSFRDRHTSETYISPVLIRILKHPIRSRILAFDADQIGYGIDQRPSIITHSQYAVLIDLLYYYELVEEELIEDGLYGRPSREIMYYLTTKSNSELLDMLGPGYRGPQDRASMLFTAHTGYVTEMISYTPERYQEVSQLFPLQVAWMTSFMYPLANDIENRLIITAIGPYRFLAAQDKGFIDNILYNLDEHNAEDKAREIGIHLDHTKVYDNRRDRGWMNKPLYQINNWLIRYGEAVFTRPPGLLMPFPVRNVEELRFFTDDELAEHYEFYGHTTRETMLQLITIDPKIWGQGRYRYAANADEEDLITLEPRRTEYVKNVDMVFYYGRIYNYHSWTVDELLYAFEPDSDGSYMFRRPSIGNSFFPISVIRELRDWLEYHEKNDNLLEPHVRLLELINAGLRYYHRIDLAVLKLKMDYNSFTEQERALISLYIFWLFTFGQYARFWKGPGNPFQYHRLNFEFNPELQDSRFCTPFQRNILSQVQLVVYRTILHNLSLHPHHIATTAWITQLPIIQYDLMLDEAVFRTSDEMTTIDQLLNKAEFGQLCMMFTSDTTIETSYFLVKRILGQDLATFNHTLRAMLPILREIELNIVVSKLNEARSSGNSDSALALTEQLDRLTISPIPYQIDFNPQLRKRTGEADPDQAMRELRN